VETSCRCLDPTGWLAGFEVIGGEYFLMWQSHTWNGQESAFRFAALCVLGLLFLAQHE
jgi:predicted small integral membrane protein